jgi:hypothetical protein
MGRRQQKNRSAASPQAQSRVPPARRAEPEAPSRARDVARGVAMGAASAGVICLVFVVVTMATAAFGGSPMMRQRLAAADLFLTVFGVVSAWCRRG